MSGFVKGLFGGKSKPKNRKITQMGIPVYWSGVAETVITNTLLEQIDQGFRDALA